jgi:hypothetical protein
MIVREIIATCTNPQVAGAAIDSIGGDFALRLPRAAAGRNLSSGRFAERLVRRFAVRAEESDWDGVWEATRGSEMPVLSGLRYLIERACELDERDGSRANEWLAIESLNAIVNSRPSDLRRSASRGAETPGREL